MYNLKCSVIHELYVNGNKELQYIILLDHCFFSVCSIFAWKVIIRVNGLQRTFVSESSLNFFVHMCTYTQLLITITTNSFKSLML